MPRGLTRYHHSRQTHFVTFSCFHRKQYLTNDAIRAVFVEALEAVRQKFRLRVYGFVIMPEHVHLLISEPELKLVADAIHTLKLSVSKTAQGLPDPPRDNNRFWQTRYYDHNVRSDKKFLEKLRYIHRNPVKRGLCAKPEDWPWSSFNHYATGVACGVEIESEWLARSRERAMIACPR